VSVGHNGGCPAGQDVFHPICACSIGEGDQNAVVVIDCYNRRLITPTRTASNVTDDRGVRLFRPG
jgi:hypothetical protein